MFPNTVIVWCKTRQSHSANQPSIEYVKRLLYEITQSYQPKGWQALGNDDEVVDLITGYKQKKDRR